MHYQCGMLFTMILQYKTSSHAQPSNYRDFFSRNIIQSRPLHLYRIPITIILNTLIFLFTTNTIYIFFLLRFAVFPVDHKGIANYNDDNDIQKMIRCSYTASKYIRPFEQVYITKKMTMMTQITRAALLPYLLQISLLFLRTE